MHWVEAVCDLMAICGNIEKPGTHVLVHNSFDINAGYSSGEDQLPEEWGAKKLTSSYTFGRKGADYIAFGALFPSSTKAEAPRAAPALFARARALGVPMVAIGGISPDNVRQAVDAGADLVAVIAGVFDAPDPAAAARAIAAAFE